MKLNYFLLNIFVDYIQKRARIIVAATQENNCDDPEEWTCEAVEMAHALVRLVQDGVVKVKNLRGKKIIEVINL